MPQGKEIMKMMIEKELFFKCKRQHLRLVTTNKAKINE